jgi:hypothetical protein
METFPAESKPTSYPKSKLTSKNGNPFQMSGWVPEMKYQPPPQDNQNNVDVHMSRM